MADDPRKPDHEPTEEEILEALEAEEGEGSLSEDIAKKWDPERMLRMVSKRAGKADRLDESTRRRYERKLGTDLGDVRIYTGEFAEEVTKAHRAEALTIGSTGMVLMGGSPDRSMATTAGRALLAHELTHVAQAQRGVHRKSSFGDSAPLATGANEQEAEAAEAAEYAEAEGGGEDGQDDKDEKLFELVRRRVLDMFEEEERLYLMRNGMDPWRP